MISIAKLLLEVKRMPYFKDEDELVNRLNEDPSLKKIFVEDILITLGNNDDPEWNYVRDGWVENDIVFEDNIGDYDCYLLDNGEDDIAYFSTDEAKIKQLAIDSSPKDTQYQNYNSTKFSNLIIYFKYI